MSALIVLYIIASFAATPFLAFHLLRTRRDLNALRDELRARGITVSAGGGARPAVAASHDAAHQLGGAPPGSSPAARSVAHDERAAPASGAPDS